MDTDYKGNLYIDNQLTTGLNKDKLAELETKNRICFSVSLFAS
jgi:lipoprotein-releasing system ATP-binding protein